MSGVCHAQSADTSFVSHDAAAGIDKGQGSRLGNPS